MKILITGATGFIGSHLVERLAARKDEICALVRPGRIIPKDLKKIATTLEIDLSQPAQILTALRNFKPDAIFHLAAQSLPMLSWQKPWDTMRNNILSSLNIFDAARDAEFIGPVIVAGSSSEYAVSDNDPIDEQHPLGASSPYAASKIAVDQLAQLYNKRYGLKILRFRPFFWIGPRKTGDFCSDTARRLVQAKKEAGGIVKIGNLEAVRDMLDIRDGIEALLVLLNHGKSGEVYNICSGKGVKLKDALEIYMSLLTKQVQTEIDPALLRPIDEPVRIGDPKKIMALGWKPTHALQDTLTEILNYWNQQ